VVVARLLTCSHADDGVHTTGLEDIHGRFRENIFSIGGVVGAALLWLESRVP
jgi:hypothetical protein